MPYSNIAVDEHLINAPYYQGFQTKIEADELLPKKNGTFLVRLIEQNWGELIYIVSVYWNGKKRHFRISETWYKNRRCFYFVKKTKPRNTIPELIRFHRFTQMPICVLTGAKLRSYVERSHFSLYREQLQFEGSVGRGEFGEVRKGRLRLGIWSSVDVAIKQDKEGKDPHDRIKFLREANVMMRLKHRNIVRLYGVVVYNDPILIVTEYASGGSLQSRLYSAEPPANSEKKRFCRDICHGMAYLESKVVLHRDLSAKNCLLDANGTVKIADFGLSSLGKSHYVKPSARAPMRFTAPETLKGGIYSFKTDVWAYGCVLFEIWKFPYEGPYQEYQNYIVLRKKILHEGLRLAPPKNMPNKLKELMLSCHRTEPDERPSFSEIKEKYFWQKERHCREDITQICTSILRYLSI